MTTSHAAVLLTVASLSCTAEVDERPATFEVILTTILRPSCAREGLCHSSAVAQFVDGPAFDVDTPEVRSNLASAITWCRLNDNCPGGQAPMPRDGRLSDADLALIEAWRNSVLER